MEQSVDSDFFKKLKAIASLPIPYLAHISRFFLKKKISQKIRSTWAWESSFNYFNCSSSTFKVELRLWWKKNLFSWSVNLKDCRQITFVTLNEFCPLNKQTKKNQPSVLNRQDQDGYNTNQFFYIVFQVLKGTSYKNLKDTVTRSLVVFISFYISRYHFSQVFRTSFNIIWKKDFQHKFSFFNEFS